MRTPEFRRSGHHALPLVLIAALALPIGGCARTRTKSDVPYIARDVGTLYNTARTRLDQHRYKEAAQLFDEVERQHPYSIWARRAQLMSAYSYYLNRDYTESIQSAQRFLSVHPGNKDAPYAYYLIALGYYEQISDVTRDQKISRQALESLGELMRRYPNTRYAADARLKVDLVNDHLAGKEMEIGRFYETRGQWLAATLRFRTVVENYQTTTHVPEALERLTETYLALGVPQEAQKSAAVLSANYPGSPWYQRAYKLMRAHPVETYALVQPGQPIIPTGTLGTQGNVPGTPKVTPTAPVSTEPTPATTGSGADGTRVPSPGSPESPPG